jgi:hypothetical protein
MVFNSEQIMLGADGCIELWVGSEEDGLFGKIVNDAEIKQQNLAEFMKLLSNGVPLHQMPFMSSLPPDFFVGTNANDPDEPLLAFVGSEDCQLTIQIVCLFL